jgi:hypothetical protein
MSKNYEQYKVLKDLQRLGIKVKYNKKKKPIFLTAKESCRIGIRTWGKIDFLKMNLVRKG